MTSEPNSSQTKFYCSVRDENLLLPIITICVIIDKINSEFKKVFARQCTDDTVTCRDDGSAEKKGDQKPRPNFDSFVL